MYIGLISDTHGIFSNEFKEFLSPCDVLWHAGDWGGDEAFIQSVRDFKPVVGVYGNCDGLDARRIFPERQFFDCEGMSVLMTHIGGSPGHYDSRAAAAIRTCRPQIFVCGHSHILKVMNDSRYDMMYINPGAAGKQGWQIIRTALRFHIDAGKGLHDMEVFNLPV